MSILLRHRLRSDDRLTEEQQEMLNRITSQPMHLVPRIEHGIIMKEATVADVHHDFNTACIKILQDANDILDQSRDFKYNEDYDKIAKLGFGSHPKIKQAKDSKDIIEKHTTIKDQLMRFKTDYPYKKFITKKELDNIVTKYGLVVSTPERFIGEFPDKNIKDVVNFKLKEQDVYMFDYDGNPISEEDVLKDPLKYYKTLYERRNGSSSYNYDYYFLNVNLKHIVEKYGYNLILETESARGFNFDLFHKIKHDEFSNTNRVIVVGTKDQFSIRVNESVVNGQIMTLKDDPIVLKQVLNGYLIVTMWGDEAQLPELKDNTLN